jgi:hypothetical protein
MCAAHKDMIEQKLQDYIHKSKVPISYGGTMKEPINAALQQAYDRCVDLEAVLKSSDSHALERTYKDDDVPYSIVF